MSLLHRTCVSWGPIRRQKAHGNLNRESLLQELLTVTEDWSEEQTQEVTCREFPGGPVVRTPRFHCRGPGLDPWSGN